MAQKPHSKEDLQGFWQKYVEANYNVCEMARRFGGSRATWESRIAACLRIGLKPPEGPQQRKERRDTRSRAALREVWDQYVGLRYNAYALARELKVPNVEHVLRQARIKLGVSEPEGVKEGVATTPDTMIVRLLRKPGGATLTELCEALTIGKDEARTRIEELASKHFNVHLTGEHWSIHSAPQTAVTLGRKFEQTSDEKGLYRFGFVADSHIASKYARTDVLNEIYDTFEAEGITTVYHCGNMIDGFKRGVNDHDVLVTGMDDQIKMLVREYPQRPGITTYAVSGDDHEGWFAQAMGIDIGKRIEQSMRESGRMDWVDLGYMECFVSLHHAQSGAEAKLLVSHPGGGSSYADSYVVQKIIESFEGGEKPGIAAFGHYHKCLSGEYRNVWFALVPCTQDQTPWARKKRLRYVIGGMIVEATQDEQGAIVRFRDEKLRYFNRGYYNDRWSHSGDIILPARTR